ncbi:MAG: LysM peptidoglycan-binding domain-containing protein [Opitutaceae bacterium]
MEEDINESSSSMLPVALGVLAIAIGGAGLYFGMTANQRLNPLTKNIEDSSGSSAQIEQQLASLETKLAEVTAQSDDLKQIVNRLRVYSAESERNAKSALSGVKSNREEMVKLVEKLNGNTAGVRSQPVSPSVSSSTSSAPVAVASESAAGFTSGIVSTGSSSVYSIQSGDNLAKIAAAKGVSLQALLDANPGVDPRRLQIGQQVNIPAN